MVGAKRAPAEVGLRRGMSWSSPQLGKPISERWKLPTVGAPCPWPSSRPGGQAARRRAVLAVPAGLPWLPQALRGMPVLFPWSGVLRTRVRRRGSPGELPPGGAAPPSQSCGAAGSRGQAAPLPDERVAGHDGGAVRESDGSQFPRRAAGAYAEAIAFAAAYGACVRSDGKDHGRADLHGVRGLWPGGGFPGWRQE